MALLNLLLLTTASSFELGKRRAKSLRECLAVCAEVGQQPACVSEAQHAAAVTAISSTTAYIGNVLNASSGTSVCPGARASITWTWAADLGLFGQPDDRRWLSATEVGVLEGCIIMASNGVEDVPCDAGRDADCLCEAPSGGGLSSGYNEMLEAREAEEAAARDEDGGRLGLALGLAAAVAILVEWTVRFMVIGRVFRMGKANQTQAYLSAAPEARPDAKGMQEADGEEHDASDDVSSRAAAKLDAAKESARRVRRTVAAVGTSMSVLGVLVFPPLTFLLMIFNQPFGPAGIAFIICVSFGLALQQDPTMPRRVRMAINFDAMWFLPSCTGGFAGAAMWMSQTPYIFSFCSTRDPRCAELATLGAAFMPCYCVVFASISCALLPALYATKERALVAGFDDLQRLLAEQRKVLAETPAAHSCLFRIDFNYLMEGVGWFEMPAHTAINRWFTLYRVFFFFFGLSLVAIAVVLEVHPMNMNIPAHTSWGGFLPMGIVTMLVPPSVLSPRARQAFAAWIGRLGSADEERKAAAVAAFMGEISPSKALALGRSSFCGLEWRTFNMSDLSNTDLAQKSSLRSRTQRLPLGRCDAFLSHSWHDQLGPKWVALDQWAEAFDAKNRRPPMLWLEYACARGDFERGRGVRPSEEADGACSAGARCVPPSLPPSLPLSLSSSSKACIDQQNIDQSLACLPVYLAGCQKLLVVAGPTYVQRLWCICEVFTFVQMGSELTRVEVVPVSGGADHFDKFTVADCKCFKIEDKGKLLGAIESAFGSHDAFDAVMRTLLVSTSDGGDDVATRLRRGKSGHSSGRLRSHAVSPEPEVSA